MPCPTAYGRSLEQSDQHRRLLPWKNVSVVCDLQVDLQLASPEVFYDFAHCTVTFFDATSASLEPSVHARVAIRQGVTRQEQFYTCSVATFVLSCS